MMANLRSSAVALPPSQVVRTVPRFDNTSLITVVNVPPIAAAPVTGNTITVSGTTVDIPL
jgi:hydroxybutyrate-dimer hydrolase